MRYDDEIFRQTRCSSTQYPAVGTACARGDAMRWEQLLRGSLRKLLSGNGDGRVGDECADGEGAHSDSDGVFCAPVRLHCKR